MILRDTPPSSPHTVEEINEDEMVYLGDADEVLEALEADDSESENEMNNEEPAIDDNAITVFSKHEASVFAGSLSKDGRLAATGGEDDKAYVWDVSSGEVILECTGHVDSVTFVQFSHDGSYLATADMSGIIHVWKLSSRLLIWNYNIGDMTVGNRARKLPLTQHLPTLAAILQNQSRWVYNHHEFHKWMQWHAVANVLFGGAASGEIYMWKIPSGECKILQSHGQRVDQGVLMPDNKRIAVGYEDGTLRLFDLKSQSVLSTILPEFGHNSTITALDCHSDNNVIMSSAMDGKTILSTAYTGKVVRVLQDLNEGKPASGEPAEPTDDGSGEVDKEQAGNWVEAIAFCKDPKYQVAATGTVNGQIFIWDILKQVLRHTMQQESGISKLVWHGNTSVLYSSGLDGVVRCFDAKAGQFLHSYTGHSADILDLNISSDGKVILTTSDDSTARIFKIGSAD